MNIVPNEKVPHITIGSTFKVSSGGTPNRKKNEYFSNGNIPWVKTGDLKGKYANKPSESITKIGLDNSSAKLFPPKTVLLAMYGATIGACSILSFEAATNQACAAILPSDECSEVYLYYYLRSIRRTLVNQGVGGAQPNISAGLIKKLKIPLPPLPEQKKIAEILDAADALRQKDQQLIDHYTALSQSLFLDMFGDPCYNNKSFPRKAIGEAIKINGGSQPPKTVFIYEPLDGYIRLIQIRDYKSDKYLTYIPNQSTKKICSKKDIMIGRYGPPVFQILRGLEGAYNVALMKAVPLKNLNSEYVFNLLSCKYIQNLIIGNSKRTAGQTGVNLKLLNSIEINIPPIELQNQFAERIKIIEQQKQQAQDSLEQSNNLFKCLLQKAFTGELTGGRS